MKFFSHSTIKKIWLNKVISYEMLLSLSMILLPVIFPETAHAGLFSFFSGQVSHIAGDNVLAQAPVVADAPNSQNMGILQAAVNTDPNPHKSSSDAPLVSGNALLAEIGPSGPITDVDDQTNTQISTYVVHPGDTLSKIAKMFDVSVNTIIWANGLSSNPTLKEGQILLILPVTGIKYTVKKGDTIKGIVAKYKSADLNDVLKYNDLTIDSTLSPGDFVIIPNVEGSISVSSPAKKGARKYVPGSNPVHDADGPDYPDYYIRPIDHGRVSQGLHGYNAVDLAAPIGTPIHAAAAGTVIAAVSNGAWNGGYGDFVIISHSNGTQTLYAHASKVLVQVGQDVTQGQLIAKIGMTGETTGPHVHFEIRHGKNPFAEPVEF